ncbi:hypothetical protein STRCI_004710 [Streptomyces cinnabarinus]|uniref:DUF1795 domain-containing protein n=1 Tax=Streptomyces cinnabarinus TaxID=67287 RepID=A0ABY7KFQ4_9ACTN|nr:hypothetical protein [Streptomyces cinnabarinus]WAZ23371.1 hypothetical protein STRCI_004710 [Streptomyces cinnabarinus]
MPAEQTKSVSTPITGYRIILPDDWAQIPLRHGTEEAIRSILDDAFSHIPANAPPDSVGPFKRELERRFRAAVAQAQESEALDLYLPVKSTAGVNVGASIVVSESLLPNRGNAAEAQSAPTDVAVQLLSEDGAQDADLSSGELDGALAVRREHIVSADPAKGAELASRRVEYIVSVPDEPDRWFVAAFSTVGGGDPRDDLAEALVEWFDAVMATLRWSHG